jgi:hypothetical protein
MTLDQKQSPPDRVAAAPVEGLRFLREAARGPVADQVRDILARVYEERPGLYGLKPHRLYLAPTLDCLDVTAESHTYAVMLQVVPTVALTHFESYTLLIGLLELLTSFEHQPTRPGE